MEHLRVLVLIGGIPQCIRLIGEHLRVLELIPARSHASTDSVLYLSIRLILESSFYEESDSGNNTELVSRLFFLFPFEYEDPCNSIIYQ